MHQFDNNDDGTVDVVEFTKTFFKMGFEERGRRTKERREADAAHLQQEREEERRREEDADKKNALKVDHSFAEKDMASVMEKFKLAAARYDKTHPSSMGLDAFYGAEMPPHVFKEQLKR
ncbi:unnamed protein product, partial [Discosporangium mesarthrocarpum]